MITTANNKHPIFILFIDLFIVNLKTLFQQLKLHTATNERITVNNGFERIVQEAVVA